jgi:hypothetical protein
MVLITDRGKEIQKKLTFLDHSPEYSRKGPLERQDSPPPKQEINTSRPAETVNPRRDLVARVRERPTAAAVVEDKSSERGKSTIAPVRRETRSQAAITKNIPYNPPP